MAISIIGNSALDVSAIKNGSATLTLPTTSGTILAQNASAPANSLVVDASGNVGIGTSSPTSLLDVYAATGANFIVRGDSGTNITAHRSSNDAFGSNIVLGKSRGTFASQTAVTSSDIMGTLYFSVYGGTSIRNIATISGVVGTYTSDTDISSLLTFSTTSTGVTPTERMRIDSVGNLLVGTTSASVPSTTGFVSSANTFSFKNRIINGNMAIDQRNAGASVTPTADSTYSVDRFTNRLSQASKYSVQQVIDAPAGLYNSLKFTSLSAYTLTSTDFFGVDQRIEGNNWSDLGWGKATGVSVTLSFWVKSSLTGTFGATMFAYTNGYPSYPFSYTITTANTWQQIVITIPAPPVTSGWGVGSAGCVLVEWSLGTGSTLKGTANTWNTTTIYRAATTENVSFVSNNAATWQITGVQLEKGSVATSFDQRAYSQELAMCQRYYQKSYSVGVAPGTNTFEGFCIYTSWGDAGGYFYGTIQPKVIMRSVPTMSYYTPAGTSGKWKNQAAADVNIVTHNVGDSFFSFQFGPITAVSTGQAYGHYVASAEL